MTLNQNIEQPGMFFNLDNTHFLRRHTLMCQQLKDPALNAMLISAIQPTNLDPNSQLENPTLLSNVIKTNELQLQSGVCRVYGKAQLRFI